VLASAVDIDGHRSFGARFFTLVSEILVKIAKLVFWLL
jgi:hypothetical protein